MNEPTPVVIIAGPTASGKSQLALALAEALNGVVINADSMQVYRELHILTSRPGEEDLARAPHRLYGVLSGAERCSAGRWRALAVAEIEAAREAGRVPVIVGGTGFYIKALMDGLSPIPEVPEAHANAADARYREQGGAAMLAALAARDPETAARLAAGDRQRLVRAWAVLEATGRPLSDWQREAPPVAEAGHRFHTVVLEPPRAELYAACDARFDAMLAAGALDEVRALDALGLDPGLPIMRALGVPELRRCLAGETPREQAVSAAKQATRNFAKRQYTWFRHQIQPSARIGAQYSESLEPEIFSDIRHFLLTRPV